MARKKHTIQYLIKWVSRYIDPSTNLNDLTLEELKELFDSYGLYYKFEDLETWYLKNEEEINNA